MNTKIDFVGMTLAVGDTVETTNGAILTVTEITIAPEMLRKADIGGTIYMKRHDGKKVFHMAMDANNTVKNGIVCSFRS